MIFEGRVDAIHLIAERGGEPEAVARAVAAAGLGLVGDRKYGRVDAKGAPRPEAAITLIEAEALVAMARDHALELAPGASRRNVVVRGVPLNHLVGRRFRLGEVLLSGYELCEPCKHLEKLTTKGVLKALTHRGGLRAYIIEGGEFAVGDAVRPA